MSKYGNRKTVIDNITFDSLAESRRYQELKLLEAAGEIEKLTLQPKFELIPAFTDRYGKKHRAIWYIGDFSYYEPNSVYEVVEDVKAVHTAVFKLKHKLMLCYFPMVDFRVIPA